MQIFAATGGERGALAELPKELHRYGFKDIQINEQDGKHVLTVEKVKTAKLAKLVTMLEDRGLVHGQADTNEEKSSEKTSLWQNIQEDALKYSGRIGGVGHLALALRGVVRRDWNQLRQAPLGAAVPLILGLCGNGQEARDAGAVLDDMRAYFKREGIPFPHGDDELHQKNLLETARHFIARNPTLVAGTLGVVGAQQGVMSGSEITVLLPRCRRSGDRRGHAGDDRNTRSG